MFDPPSFDRRSFMRIACSFEGGLVGLAYLLGWLVDLDPFAQFRFTGGAVSYGMLATMPLLAAFLWVYRIDHPEIARIRRFLFEGLAPHLAVCRWYDQLLLAAVAGLGEEALFRGVLQPWAENHWGWLAGLLISNLGFALAHCVTLCYAALALLVGIYLGVMMDVGGERNLLTPIVIHAFYDFIAFRMVVQAYRVESAADRE